ncbi:Mobile element protein (plasmid) [Rhodococcus sp. WAY2]|nr:Mobile element protein [Rhodococcus sp. WAY2]
MYPVIFIDAIHVKVRDGQVTNRPIYVAIGVTVNGERDILGLWAGDGGEGAKFWLAVLTELKHRGVADVCIVVCDGLKGLPDAITAVWDRTIVQTCVIHLLTELPPEFLQVMAGADTVRCHDRIRWQSAGSGRAGGGSPGFTDGDRRGVAAVAAA